MKKLIYMIMLFNTLTVFANPYEYYQIDEYLNLTGQKELSDKFNKIVQNDAVKIDKETKEIKVVMIYPGNQISDYWRKSKISFEKRLKQLGIKYQLDDFFTKPAIEIKEQSKQLLNAMKLNPDYLIFTLDVNKHAKFIERIVSREKSKIILQNITTPLKNWNDRQPFLYVGFDHFMGSKYLADYYIKNSKENGKYAVLYGTKGYVSLMRGTKFIEYVSKNSNLKLVHEYYTDFDKVKAKNATLNLLDIDSNIEFIYACSTDIALGVVEALKERNLLGKIKVNGWGGGASELYAIEKGLLDITVMRMNDDNGVAMAEAIKLDLLGQKVPTIYSGEFNIVEKGIDKTQLEKFKNRAFRYTLDE